MSKGLRKIANSKHAFRTDNVDYFRDAPRFEIGGVSSNAETGTTLKARNGGEYSDLVTMNGIAHDTGAPVVFLTGNSKERVQILGPISWYTGIDVTS